MKSAPRAGLPRPLALLVAGAFFMENLDGTILSTAAPKMAESFHVLPVDLNVAITAYLLTLAILIPGSGWLSDRFGSRRIFCLAIAVFTVSSLLCALSTSLPELTALRVLQGVGGAMMVPVGRLVVIRATAKAEVVRAIAYLTWPALAAPVVAPLVGGLLTTYASWRWIFVVNLPLGLMAFFVALRIVPDTRTDQPKALDWRGFLLTGFGAAALIVAIEGVGGGRIVITLVSAGVAIALIGWAVLHLMRWPDPLLDLRILRLRTFRVSNSGGSVVRLVVNAVPFLLPLLFQIEFGWSPVKSGAFVIALFAGNLSIKPFTTPILRHWGFRALLLISVTGSGVVLVLCALITSGTPTAAIAVLLYFSGVFRSTGFTGYNSIAFADIDPADLTHANTLSATVQQLAMGLGVALGALVLRLAGPIANSIGWPRSGPYGVSFVILAILLIPSLVEVIRLPRSAGSAISPSANRRAVKT